MTIRVTTLSLIAAGSCSTPLSVWTIERIGPELVGACGLWSCHQILLWRLETHRLTHQCSTQVAPPLTVCLCSSTKSQQKGSLTEKLIVHHFLWSKSGCTGPSTPLSIVKTIRLPVLPDYP
ncbi:unnamed protein product [Sphagnum balticum]